MRISIPTCRYCPLQGKGCDFRAKLKIDLAPVKGVKLNARITCPQYPTLYDVGDEVVVQIHEYYPGGGDPYDEMSWDLHSAATGRVKARPKRGQRFFIVELNKPVTVDYPPDGAATTITHTRRDAKSMTCFMKNPTEPCSYCGNLGHETADCPQTKVPF